MSDRRVGVMARALAGVGTSSRRGALAALYGSVDRRRVAERRDDHVTG